MPVSWNGFLNEGSNHRDYPSAARAAAADFAAQRSRRARSNLMDYGLSRGAGSILNFARSRRNAMEHVYKTIEITGSSKQSADDAIRTALEKASQSLKNLRWFKVIETRGMIEGSKVQYWQVTMQVGFTLE
jgi:flavin-binding protein dodecin